MLWSILLPSSLWSRVIILGVLDPGYTGAMILCNVRAAYWTPQCNTATTSALCSCELAQLNVPTLVFWTLPWHWCLNSNYCPRERNFKFKVPKNALTKHAAHNLGIYEQLNIASSQRPILNCWHTFCNLILSTWFLCSLLAVSILMNVGIGLVVLLHVWRVLASNISPETFHLDWVFMIFISCSRMILGVMSQWLLCPFIALHYSLVIFILC